MDKFSIKDTNRSVTLQFEGNIPKGLTGYDGCHFIARLSSLPLSAEVKVYDIRPDRWGTFFNELAENWRGWKGVKDHESLEGHLRMEATSDSLGHINLRISIRGVEVGDLWLAESSISLESGQLADVARNALAFFGVES
jgi:hypothetical protein